MDLFNLSTGLHRMIQPLRGDDLTEFAGSDPAFAHKLYKLRTIPIQRTQKGGTVGHDKSLEFAFYSLVEAERHNNQTL